jgi:hypothetical protein
LTEAEKMMKKSATAHCPTPGRFEIALGGQSVLGFVLGW